MQTAEKKRLPETLPQQLTVDGAHYALRIPDVTLAAGVYRLTIKVTLQSVPALIACAEFPLLQVR
jgi:hypothetical protein